MASNFSPRSRGDREFQKFGIHDTATDANPIILHIGGQAKNTDGTTPGEVTEDDTSVFKTDLAGRLFVNDAHPRFFSISTSYVASTTEIQLRASPGTGLSLYLTDVMLSVGDNAGTIRLKDGNAGGINLDIVPPMAFAANGGAVLNLRTPLKLVANSSLAMTSTGATNHSVIISGYIAT